MSKVIIKTATEQDLPQWIRLRCALWPDCSLERQRLEVKQILEKQGDGWSLLPCEGMAPCAGLPKYPFDTTTWMGLPQRMLRI